MWVRSAAHTKASAAAGGGIRGLRARAALVAALALLGALAFTTPALAAFTEVTSFDGSRTPAGSMAPEHAAVDESTGNIYVIDSAGDAVDIFNRYGKYLSQLTGPSTPGGTFGFDNFSDDIAVDNSSAGTQGNVYIVGEHSGANPPIVTAFRSDGSFLWQVNSPFPAPSRFGGIGVDPLTGDVWVGDRRRGMFRLSPADGTSVGDTPIGLNGAPVDSGNEGPVHLAFDSDGNLYGAPIPSSNPTVKFARGVSDPPFADPATATIDPIGAMDLEVDQTNGDIYVDHGDSIAVYDRTGTPDPSAPFGSSISGSGLHGLAVNGPDQIYVENQDTNTVDIWAHVPPVIDSLTVTVDGSGTGNVDADHGAILGCGSNGGPCTGDYIDGDPQVELTATPDSGMRFAGWSGVDATACADPSAPVCDVPMDAAKNITATFETNAVPQHTLTVSKSGDGTGGVTSSPAGIDCGATCSALFDDGTSVTLTATPDGSDTISGWTGCDSVGAGNATCTVSMTADRGVTVTFRAPTRIITRTLTVSKGGDGTGTVTSSPGGITCGATCSALFNDGTSVTLTAAADAGSTFASWSGGGCSGTGTCGVTLSGDTTVTATFSKIPVVLQCPQDLSKCPRPVIGFAGFSSKTLLVRLTCTEIAGGPACTGKLTFKAVIKVRVKHGKKTKLVKKTITVATASYNVAAAGSGSVKLKLTSAAKSALKRGSLTARSTNPKATIHLPKTKVKKKKKH